MTEKSTIKKTENTQVAVQDMIGILGTAAMNKDVDADKMEKMLNIQIRMMDRQAEIEFNEAFSVLMQEMPTVTKHGKIKNASGKVTSTYSKYEDLDRVVRPVMLKHGFSFQHTSEEVAGKMLVRTTLRHSGGHKSEATITLPMDATNKLKSAMQAAKSTLSFGKRTNVISILNIVEEDEGDSAQYIKISLDEAIRLDQLIAQKGAIREKVLQFARVSDIREISVEALPSITDQLNSMRDAIEEVAQ